jgi:hypothetical protein
MKKVFIFAGFLAVIFLTQSCAGGMHGHASCYGQKTNNQVYK